MSTDLVSSRCRDCSRRVEDGDPGHICQDLNFDSGTKSLSALTFGPADPLFCDLLSNLHLHLEHEVDAEQVIEVRRVSMAAVTAGAGAIERALPGIGPRGALDLLLAAYSLGSVLWQVAHPPATLTAAYSDEPELSPDWNLDFTTALTRLLTATCVGLLKPQH